jgi:hypothetical protein
MQINAQLDDELAQKLTSIQQWKNQNSEDIVKHAIALYYQQLQPQRKSPLEIFEESGFIGCIEAEPSVDQKAALYSFIDQRNAHC